MLEIQPNRLHGRAHSLGDLMRTRGPRQLVLFGPEAFAGDLSTRVGAAETLADAVDRIRGRFGDRAIVSGRMFARRAGPLAANSGTGTEKTV